MRRLGISGSGRARARLRVDDRARPERDPDVHRATSRAPGRRRRPRVARARRHSLGAARHLSRRADPAMDHRRAGAAGVRACARHPAVLGYAIGNEIPSPIVRWHGRRRTEAFLRRLYEAAKSADPDGLVTYMNYPTTEYLELPFLDFVTFNVYLSRRRLAAPAPPPEHRRRPSAHAERDRARQSPPWRSRAGRVLDWQVRTAFGAGCAGTFVFAWTDEWHRGGYDIEDWDFGVVDASGGPSRPWLPSRARSTTSRFPRSTRGRAFRSSCAPTTGAEPSPSA